MKACASQDELLRLLTEELPAEAAAQLTVHIDDCPRCQEQLERLATKAAAAAALAANSASDSTIDQPRLEFLQRLKGKQPSGLGVNLRAPGGAAPTHVGRTGLEHDGHVGDFVHDASDRPRIGPHSILGMLGEGGMGVVYKARHIRLGRLVAIKMLRGGVLAGLEDLERFQREAEAVARLQHPNIVQIFDVGDHDGRPYFSMELVEGVSLSQHLAGLPQAPHEAAALVETLARAIHHAHEHGVIHRDLKPANILLSVVSGPLSVAGEASQRTTGNEPRTIPKIADFGLAKQVEKDAGQTRTGMVMGTPSYMAPEQAAGRSRAVTPATDIYALGAILYELLTGRPPFKGTSPLSTLEQVLTREPVPPRQFQPHTPRDLETICLKCLEKEPQKRYHTALALAEDLSRFTEGRPIQARPVSPVEHAVRWARRRPMVAGLWATVGLVGALGMAGIVWQWRTAVAAEAVAGTERDRAKAERDNARWQHYRASMGAAASALQLHNTLAAGRSLESAPAEHRNWEWRHFRSRLNNTLAVFEGHQAPVNGVLFSPDGLRLVSWSSDRTLRLWDRASQRQLATLHGHSENVEFAVFTPDGRRVASASRKEICIWDVLTGELLASIPGARRVFSLDVSPDGTRIVSGDEFDLNAHVWEVSTGREVAALKHAVPPVRVAFSPDGSRILGAGRDTVQVWDARTYRPINSVQVERADIFSIAFSPDGTRLVTGWDFPDAKVRAYEVSTGKLLFASAGHQNRIAIARFSPDGSRIATASLDQTVRLWDAMTGQALAVLPGHVSNACDVRFSPDGSRLVSASWDGTLRLWDAKRGELIAVLLGHTDKLSQVAYSPDGALIASASTDKTVILWDAALVERSGVLRGHSSYVYDVAVSADGSRIVSAAWDNTVRVWDATTGQAQRMLAADARFMLSVALSRDGRRVVSGSRDSKVCSWDLESGQPRWQLQLPGNGAESLAFSPDGARLAVALGHTYGNLPGDPTVRLLDSTTGVELAVLRGHSDNVLAVRFSPDGRRIASAGYDNTIRIWDADSTETITKLNGHSRWIRAVAWNEDGTLLASGGDDRTVRLWDTRTFEELVVLPHASIVYSVAFSPAGTRLAAACEDNTIRLWDLVTKEEVAELRGHLAYVHAVTFSPDGTQLVSASGDYTVRIWDTQTLQERARTIQDVGLRFPR